MTRSRSNRTAAPVQPTATVVTESTSATTDGHRSSPVDRHRSQPSRPDTTSS